MLSPWKLFQKASQEYNFDDRYRSLGGKTIKLTAATNCQERMSLRSFLLIGSQYVRERYRCCLEEALHIEGTQPGRRVTQKAHYIEGTIKYPQFNCLQKQSENKSSNLVRINRLLTEKQKIYFLYHMLKFLIEYYFLFYTYISLQMLQCSVVIITPINTTESCHFPLMDRLITQAPTHSGIVNSMTITPIMAS